MSGVVPFVAIGFAYGMAATAAGLHPALFLLGLAALAAGAAFTWTRSWRS